MRPSGIQFEEYMINLDLLDFAFDKFGGVISGTLNFDRSDFLLPELRFSSELPTRSYKGKEIDKIITDIDKLLEDIRSNNEFNGREYTQALEGLKKENDKALDSLQELLDRQGIHGDIFYKPVKKIVEDYTHKAFKANVLGCYDCKKNRIILYYRAILNYSIENSLNYDETMEAVYAHEFFHALHYLICRKCNREWKRGRAENIVKESMAAYFEYAYCREKGYKSNADLLQSEWKRHHIDVYPYSGAVSLEGHVLTSRLSWSMFEFTLYESTEYDWAFIADQLSFAYDNVMTFGMCSFDLERV